MMIKVYSHLYDRNMRFVKIGGYVLTPFGVHTDMVTILILDMVNPGYPLELWPSALTSMQAEEVLAFADVCEERPIDSVLTPLTEAVTSMRYGEGIYFKQQRNAMLSNAYEFMDSHLVVLYALANEESIRGLKAYIQQCGAEYLSVASAHLGELCHLESMCRLHEKKAGVLQAAWREAAANPYKEICKRRLLREFSEMMCN